MDGLLSADPVQTTHWHNDRTSQTNHHDDGALLPQQCVVSDVEHAPGEQFVAAQFERDLLRVGQAHIPQAELHLLIGAALWLMV